MTVDLLKHVGPLSDEQVVWINEIYGPVDAKYHSPAYVRHQSTSRRYATSAARARFISSSTSPPRARSPTASPKMRPTFRVRRYSSRPRAIPGGRTLPVSVRGRERDRGRVRAGAAAGRAHSHAGRMPSGPDERSCLHLHRRRDDLRRQGSLVETTRRRARSRMDAARARRDGRTHRADGVAARAAARRGRRLGLKDRQPRGVDGLGRRCLGMVCKQRRPARARTTRARGLARAPATRRLAGGDRADRVVAAAARRPVERVPASCCRYEAGAGPPCSDRPVSTVARTRPSSPGRAGLPGSSGAPRPTSSSTRTGRAWTTFA